MKRREFIQNTGMAAAVASMPWACTTLDSNNELYGKNWIWVGPDPKKTKEEWITRFNFLKDNGIDAVLLEVFQGRKAHYESVVLESANSMLELAIEAAKSSGIELHAWMWTMPCLIPEILEQHPEWYNVNAKGESSATDPAYVDYYKFLCPSRPEPRSFIEKRVSELAKKDGLTGVHLDYIRHPDAILPKGLWSKYNLVQDKVYPEFDYCYCDHCRNEFSNRTGIDPLELEKPDDNMEWMQYRWDSVTSLVNDLLVPAAHSEGKLITAAVFPGPSLARTMVRQSWGDWKIDAYLPMLYHSFYEQGPEWVGELTVEGVKTVGASSMFSGLFVPGIGDAKEFELTLQEARNAGAGGVSLFGMKEEWWDTFKLALKE